MEILCRRGRLSPALSLSHPMHGLAGGAGWCDRVRGAARGVWGAALPWLLEKSCLSCSNGTPAR